MLKAVIFDMDGVLVDSEIQHKKAAAFVLKKFGAELTDEYYGKFVGSTVSNMLESMLKDFQLNCSYSELDTTYDQAKLDIIKQEGFIAIPYTKELIIDLYNHGIMLAIASSSKESEINDVVKQLGIGKYFQKLVSGATVEHPKPAPDVFILAMKELGVNHNECIIIEDSMNGIIAAKAAGVPSIGFINENSGNQDLSAANILIEGFDEIDYKFVNNIYLRANNMPVTIMNTKRLIIRELTVDDIVKLYEMYKNPEVTKYIEDIDEYLENEIEKHKSYIKNVYNFFGYGLWGVFQKESGELIGRCGIQNTIIDGQDEIELGYMLDRAHWGLGYAAECTKGIIEFAFQDLQLERLVAVIDPLNTRSLKLAERIGMKYEKSVIKNDHEYLLYVITNDISMS